MSSRIECRRSSVPSLCVGVILCVSFALETGQVSGQVLDKRRLLKEETFWDNRDWEWYEANIPFFECPDKDITTTYYYRWELLTKHLTYGSPNSGYSFTEFIDRPFWSGRYGAISCPAGHQLYEARWLRDPRYARDYLRYWFFTPGAQPRNYSTWLADSAWAIDCVHEDHGALAELLPELVKNYQGWESRHFVPQVGLFWQTGHDDGMEFNINSRQTQDILRGAPSYRPSFNAYMWADARAISKIAQLLGENGLAEEYALKAANLKSQLQSLLWDEKRQFFFPAFRDRENRDGYEIAPLSRTYESGRYAGSPHGRELIGFVPWQFEMVDDGRGYELAWKTLMDCQYFYADYGPTTVERNDPMFLLQKTCCWWSGQSWPYATTQVLKGMANLLQGYQQEVVSREDYAKLFAIYAKTHRKGGRPYLAEACDPDTGSFEGHDGYNHSEHYFHSAYCDNLITGLVGVRFTDGDGVVVHPLANREWDWFALDSLLIRGHDVAILWDRDGSRYGRGEGLSVLLDGIVVARSETMDRLEFSIPRREQGDEQGDEQAEPMATRTSNVNFAVNNDGDYYPRMKTSVDSATTSVGVLADGNYWYHQSPPNRWVAQSKEGRESEWVELDLGVEREVETVKVYVVDDRGEGQSRIKPPRRVELEVWQDQEWRVVASAEEVKGNCPVHLSVAGTVGSRFRVVFYVAEASDVGISEIEIWGPVAGPYIAPEAAAGNLALNRDMVRGEGSYPKVTASHTSPYDRVEAVNDGVTQFQPHPNNRWTSYQSPGAEDWLEVDFGMPREFQRIELALYDDRGGVQAPESYRIEYWEGDTWHGVDGAKNDPAKPIGSQWNESRFRRVTSNRVRVVFRHAGLARSGVTEILIWND